MAILGRNDKAGSQLPPKAVTASTPTATKDEELEINIRHIRTLMYNLDSTHMYKLGKLVYDMLPPELQKALFLFIRTDQESR